jgi:hypothetical protein
MINFNYQILLNKYIINIKLFNNIRKYKNQKNNTIDLENKKILKSPLKRSNNLIDIKEIKDKDTKEIKEIYEKIEINEFRETNETNKSKEAKENKKKSPLKKQDTFVDLKNLKKKYNYDNENENNKSEEKEDINILLKKKLHGKNKKERIQKENNDNDNYNMYTEDKEYSPSSKINNNNNRLSVLQKFPNLINLYRSETFKYKILIPKTSQLNINEENFIKKGEFKKIIEMKMNKNSHEKNAKPQILTPFQMSIYNNSFLKDKLHTNKEVSSDKAILVKKKYDKTKCLNYETTKHPSSTCTIFNFKVNENSPHKFKEIFLERLKDDNSLFDFSNKVKEILPNKGINHMSHVGFGN